MISNIREWSIRNETFVMGACVALCVIALALSVRGISGNPTHENLNNPEWKDDGPLELSPDRGRFALIFSIVEDHSLQYSLPVARFATPDLGITPDGKYYVSLFAPGPSFIAIPGYLIGRAFGVAQVGTFAIIALFAILNVFLIRAIAMRLGATSIPALLGGLAFLFGTPAFTYAVTLYQHHISTFLILLSIYALLHSRSLASLALIWFLCAASVVIDNPNFFLMAPIGLFALGRVLWIERAGIRDVRRIVIRPAAAITLITMAIPVVFFLWFNYASHGDALRLSGTLQAVKVIDEQGRPAKPNTETGGVTVLQDVSAENKTALGSFKTRNLLNGFYIHLFSPDRGVLTYAPVILLGLFGLVLLYRKNSTYANLLAAVLGVDILLYSMWGDPWGGWAFGSRYLIPAYALLGIGLGLAFTKWRKSTLFFIAFVVLAGYSVWVNALGAVTTSRNPPEVEVLGLEALSGREEKYTWEKNLQYLEANRSKSFAFQEYFGRHMSAVEFQRFVTGLILAGMFSLAAASHFGRDEKQHA